MVNRRETQLGIPLNEMLLYLFLYTFQCQFSYTIRSELLRLLRSSGRKAWDLERLYPASRCPFDLLDFSRKIQDDPRDLCSQGREYVHNFYSAGLEQYTPLPKKIWSSVFLGIRVKVPNLLRPSSKHTFSFPCISFIVSCEMYRCSITTSLNPWSLFA